MNENEDNKDICPEPENADIELSEHSVKSIEFPDDPRDVTDPFDLSPTDNNPDTSADSGAGTGEERISSSNADE